MLAKPAELHSNTPSAVPGQLPLHSRPQKQRWSKCREHLSQRGRAVRRRSRKSLLPMPCTWLASPGFGSRVRTGAGPLQPAHDICGISGSRVLFTHLAYRMHHGGACRAHLPGGSGSSAAPCGRCASSTLRPSAPSRAEPGSCHECLRPRPSTRHLRRWYSRHVGQLYRIQPEHAEARRSIMSHATQTFRGPSHLVSARRGLRAIRSSEPGSTSWPFAASPDALRSKNAASVPQLASRPRNEQPTTAQS